MTNWTKNPNPAQAAAARRLPGLYSTNHDGLGDPEAFTPADRAHATVARLQSEQARRTSRSPVIRALQAAADRAVRS